MEQGGTLLSACMQRNPEGPAQHRIMIKGELHPSDIEATRGIKADVAQRLPEQVVVPT